MGERRRVLQCTEQGAEQPLPNSQAPQGAAVTVLTGLSWDERYVFNVCPGFSLVSFAGPLIIQRYWALQGVFMVVKRASVWGCVQLVVTFCPGIS